MSNRSSMSFLAFLCVSVFLVRVRALQIRPSFSRLVPLQSPILQRSPEFSKTARSKCRFRRMQPLHAAQVGKDDPREKENNRSTWMKQTKNLSRQSLAISLPALIGMLVDPLLSLMDTAYVGQLGSFPLAALGACTSIFHLAFNAFRATTSATTSLVAKCLPPSSETSGTGTTAATVVPSNDSARLVTQTSIQLGVTLGVTVAALLYIFGTRALACMGVDRSSPLFPYACQYLFCRCGAAPVVLFIQVCEGSFRGHGDTRIPLLASLTAAGINLVLDPLLMFGCGLGVRGAALATAFSQVGAGLVYFSKLKSRKMLPTKSTDTTSNITPADAAVKFSDAESSSKPIAPTRQGVIRSILGANAALFLKQGSLLLAWAYATARATRLGPTHVAAHQVGLSIWLVFALILDSTSVSAQVLVSRAAAAPSTDVSPQSDPVTRLLKFFAAIAILQGLVSFSLVELSDWVVPLFTSDTIIRKRLHALVPCLAAQQLLVSCTLVAEACAIGLSQFSVLATGTTVATVASMWQLSRQNSVTGIWNWGIVTLLGGRLITALAAITRGCMKRRHAKTT